MKCIARVKTVLRDKMEKENRGLNMQGVGSQEESVWNPKDRRKTQG